MVGLELLAGMRALRNDLREGIQTILTELHTGSRTVPIDRGRYIIRTDTPEPLPERSGIRRMPDGVAVVLPVPWIGHVLVRVVRRR